MQTIVILIITNNYYNTNSWTNFSLMLTEFFEGIVKKKSKPNEKVIEWSAADYFRTNDF